MPRSPRKRGKRSGGDELGRHSIGRATPSRVYSPPQENSTKSIGAGLRVLGEAGAPVTKVIAVVPEEATPVTKVIAAIRVSTFEQGIKGASLPEQKDLVAKHCTWKGLPIPVPIEDLADPTTAPSVLFTAVESATERATAQREVWMRALSLAQPGAVFIVTRLDRFSRSVLSGLNALNHLEANGTRLVSLAENIDTSTPVGKMIFTVLLANYQLEERNIAARTSGGRQLRRREGNWTEGSVPLGFNRGRRPQGRAGPLVVNDMEDHIVLEAFLHYDEGRACWNVGKLYKEKHPGLRRWSTGLIVKMLRNRAYIGQMRSEANGGEWIDAHPAIVPQDLFWRVQAKLDAARASKGRPPNPETYESWFLHGLMTCGLCGASIRSARYHPSKKSKTRLPRRTTHSGWYVCYRHFSSRGPSGSEAKCTEEWPCLRNNDIHERAAHVIQERLEHLRVIWANPEVTAAREVKEKDYAAARKKIKEKIQRIADGYAEGVIDKREARRVREEAQEELAKLDAEERQQKTERDALDPVTAQHTLLESIPAIQELWEHGAPSEQRELTELLTEKIELFPNGNLTFTWRGASEVVKKLGFMGGGGLLNELTGYSGAGDQLWMTTTRVGGNAQGVLWKWRAA